MREHFTADWAFGIRGSLEKVVEKNFPQELHSWPLLKTFNFEPYIWRETHIIFVLRDKLSGIPAGPGKPHILNDPDAPREAPTIENLSEWQNYLQKRFSLRPQDATIIIPLADSGKKVKDDWSLWNESDKQLWHRQTAVLLSKRSRYHGRFLYAARVPIPCGRMCTFL